MYRIWPVPQAYSKRIPLRMDASFGAPRKYKNGWGKHTGVDIYAPLGSKILAIENGKIVHVSEFTGPPSSPQWRKTYYVMVEQKNGQVAVYGEVRKPRWKEGQCIKSGQIVGYIARVIRNDRGKYSSMLHFELHKKGSRSAEDWYKKKPSKTINPTLYLRSLT